MKTLRIAVAVFGALFLSGFIEYPNGYRRTASAFSRWGE